MEEMTETHINVLLALIQSLKIFDCSDRYLRLNKITIGPPGIGISFLSMDELKHIVYK
jgi:hypothetical protein